MKQIKTLLLILFVVQISLAQNTARVFKSAEKENSYIKVTVSDGIYIIKAYSNHIIETTFIPMGEVLNNQSHAVVIKPENITSEFEVSGDFVRYKTAGITVNIKKSPFQISYSYKGKPIISEKIGFQKIENGETIQFNLDQEEVLYGGGARALGMNRRGNRLQLYNRAHYGYETHAELMNYTMPLVMSSKLYAIHFDNAPIGYLDLDSKKDNTLTYETISGRKTYQVIVGDSWLDIIDSYTDLTGKQPLPPRWALGNFASRFGYHSQQETEATINKFKEEEIPLDAVIIDIYWFGKDIKGHMGNLEFLHDSFPDPKQMIKDFKAKGVKTVLVTEPFVLTTSKRWQEAVNKEVLAKDTEGNPFTYDFYFGNTGLIDIYDPKGKQWFWNIYKDLANLGVKGVWGDLGEPEVHPSNLFHATGTADEVHNIYGHDWARLVYEGYREEFPNERPFILMRSGFSGSQRFGLIPWSGDVNRTFGGLQSQTEIALQMGMQGLGYMHSDLGGFAGANLNDELYTRWLQYGVFQPIYRPHAQEEVPSEPVFRESETKALAKQSIELRYKLLPYNYTLAFQNNQNGTPLMRPLFFEDSTRSLWTNASTYFWGKDFLITPIVNPGVSQKEVVFPKKNVWFDFYTDTKIDGGQTKHIQTRPNYIPTYVRAGAFITMAKLVQSTDDYNANNFDLHYYHDATVTKSERQMYNDDGLTFNAFEKGEYELLSFKSVQKNGVLNLEFEAEIGSNYIVNNKDIKVVIHNIQNEPKHINVNKKRRDFIWNEENKTLTIHLEWNTEDILQTSIKF